MRMKGLAVITFILVGFSLNATPVIDGVINAGEGWHFLVANPGIQDSLVGADLDSLFYCESADSFYIAINTQNQASWSIAYGFAFDNDFTSGSGYQTGGDAWGRHITFGADIDPSFNVDYELYFWWDESTDSITSTDFCNWNGSIWDYNSNFGNYAYTGDSLIGLQTIEVAIPWGLFGTPDSMRFVAYITGGDNSSAVDVLPLNSSVAFPARNAEWTDEDTLANTVKIMVSGIDEHTLPGIFIKSGRNKVVFLCDGRKTINISLFDISGRSLMERKLVIDGETALSIPFKTGIYFLRAESSGKEAVRKIAIIR